MAKKATALRVELEPEGQGLGPLDANDAIDRALTIELVRVTERAAVAAAFFRGDRKSVV